MLSSVSPSLFRLYLNNNQLERLPVEMNQLVHLNR